MKKGFSIITLILSLALIMPGTAFAADGVILTDNGEVVVDIYHTNDVHSRATNYPTIAAYVEEIKEYNRNSLLVDAGDTLHGQSIATLERGDSIVKIMNEVGYDAMTPGNHDFNYGYERLAELSKQMSFPILSSNIYKGSEPLFAPYEIFELPNAKVAIIGATTPDTKTSTHPDNVKGIEFKDPIEQIKKSVDAVKGKADAIVVIAHIGIATSSSVTTKDIASKIPEIDAIIDGHSHSELAEGVVENGVLIAQTGEYMNNLGQVSLVLGKDGVNATASLIKIDELNTSESSAPNYIEPKPSVKKIIDDVHNKQEALLSEVISKTEFTLNGERGDVRTGETNLSDLICNIIKKETQAQIALHNGGNIRSTIPAGNITKGQVIEVLPFGNYLVTKEVKGSDVWAVMEHGLSAYPEQVGGFPQIAGIKVTFDAAKPAGSRVTEILTESGAPLDLNANYLLATNDFLAAGGDGYEMLAEAKSVGEFSALDEIVIKHLSEGFPIAEKPAGNLVVLNAGGVATAPAASAAPQQSSVSAPSAPVSEITAAVPSTTVAATAPSVTAPTSSYTVKSGDNLTTIAAQHGVTWRELYEMNKDIIKNPNYIYPGQVLKTDKAA